MWIIGCFLAQLVIISYNFIANVCNFIKHCSLFLFGPRQTGKSTYLRNKFPEARCFNLLEADTFKELATRPELIRKSLRPSDKLLIIDEIQKLPGLLDEVQAILGTRSDLRFILTGSSARKLKRGGANFLAGCALVQNFFPLVFPEVESISLIQRINRGGLPAIIDSPIYKQDLNSYVGPYLKEEILEEGLSRGIEGFSRFLEVAALSNGQQINDTEIGNDAAVKPKVVREYYQILEDTLLGWTLPAFQATKKRKPVATDKFYFFDVGVVNSLLRRGEIQEKSELFGNALEHLIFLELRAYLDYRRIDVPLSYWRSTSQLEVDFVIGQDLAIQVKSKERIAPWDYKHLLALREEFPKQRSIIVCQESHSWTSDEQVEILPMGDGPIK